MSAQLAATPPIPTSEALWNEYGSALRGFLRAKVSNPADADDLLQEILLKSHLRLASLREASSVRSWLMQIAHRTIIDFYRKRGRAAAREDASTPAEDVETWWDEHDLDAQQQLAACIRPFLKTLPPETAELLEAVEFEGASQKEIAERLGVSHSTVKSRVQRARQQLRKSLDRCCELTLDARGRVIEYTPRSGDPCRGC